MILTIDPQLSVNFNKLQAVGEKKTFMDILLILLIRYRSGKMNENGLRTVAPVNKLSKVVLSYISGCAQLISEAIAIINIH